MKEYRLVHLNKKNSWTMKKDLEKAENNLNEMIGEGWVLENIISHTWLGALVGIFTREKSEETAQE